MTTPISRRAVLRGIAIGATAPVWVRFAEPALAAPGATPNATRHLLVVFLRGGNDPLHTVAPMAHDGLRKLRPNVALRDSEMLALGNGYGLNRGLPSFYEAWRRGQLAIVQQTGPASPDFSHGTATRRWETASPEDRFATGWLGRYLDTTAAAGPVRAAAFGESMPLSLVGENADAMSMRSLSTFVFADRKARDAAARHNALAIMANAPAPRGSMLDAVQRSQRELLTAAAPLTELADSVGINQSSNAESVAELFGGGFGTEIGYLSVSGFDTHTDERGRHPGLLSELDDVVRSFQNVATARGVADQSVVMIVSEFGRRVYENRSGGTDHGYGTSVFLLGKGVRGGVYGPSFDAANLVDGNLPASVDLRQVYASVLSGWLRTNPAPILGGEFAPLPLFS